MYAFSSAASPFIVEIPLIHSYIVAFLSASIIAFCLIFIFNGEAYAKTIIEDITTGIIDIGKSDEPILNKKKLPITTINESIIIPSVVEDIAFFTVSASFTRDSISPVFLAEKKLNGRYNK